MQRKPEASRVLKIQRLSIPDLPVPYIFGTNLPVADRSGNWDPWFQIYTELEDEGMFCLSHTCQLHLINSCDTAPRNTPVNLQVGSSTVLWSILCICETISYSFAHNHGSVENSYIWKVTTIIGGTPIFDFHDYGWKCFSLRWKQKNLTVLEVPFPKTSAVRFVYQTSWDPGWRKSSTTWV